MPCGAHPRSIVESPTKARTIRSFLPKDFRVEASMGHVRDLPNNASEIPASLQGRKSGPTSASTPPNNFEPLYVVPKDKKKVVKELKDALKGADQLLLATDEDREGESISWHLQQLLQPKVPVRRMVFHEITKAGHPAGPWPDPRAIDMELVHAQETRRILDRLVGYTLSPLLWKKVAWGLSAGRVQSVAVRLLVQREQARRAFRSGSYWDLKAQLEHAGSRLRGQAQPPRRRTHRRWVPISTRAPVPSKAGSKVKLLSEAEARALQAVARARRRLAGGRGGGKAHGAQAGAPVHHQHPAAGGQPQAAPLGPRNHAHGPGALRARLHHLHAHRLGAPLRPGDRRPPAAVWATSTARIT
jgi:DNA topoisomerase-1